jgi:V8-like Glu-specific endopeptidase
MSKFNKTSASPIVRGSITTTGPATTFEAGRGFARDVTNMVGEDTFYEKADDRDKRFRDLVHEVAIEDVDWIARFIPWLRTAANMRSASIVVAVESVWARLQLDKAGENRRLIASACQRADEPGEVLAYWTSRYGRAVPKPVKRGLADAVQRLYNERSLAKYDSDAKGYRFADVIDLVHPSPADAKPWQGALFSHALDRRHHRDKPVPDVLPILKARAELLALPVEDRRSVLLASDGPRRLAGAGMTWETLAGWLQGPMDAEAWSAIIPSMGIMALARNLRNFDEAGVSDETAETVMAKFRDAEQVANSRMFPYRWLSAYMAAPSLRWGSALETALAASTAAIPELPGRTLVLVDTSGSMTGQVSQRSKVRHLDIGALIGVAIARRGCAVDLVGFADGHFVHPLVKGGSVLKEIEKLVKRSGEVGHGTRMVEAVRATYKRHDRVVIVSDMQTFPYYYNGQSIAADFVPESVPVFGINTSGYSKAALPAGTRNRFEIGGFSDKVFTMFGLLARGKDADWPF